MRPQQVSRSPLIQELPTRPHSCLDCERKLDLIGSQPSKPHHCLAHPPVYTSQFFEQSDIFPPAAVSLCRLNPKKNELSTQSVERFFTAPPPMENLERTLPYPTLLYPTLTLTLTSDGKPRANPQTNNRISYAAKRKNADSRAQREAISDTVRRPSARGWGSQWSRGGGDNCAIKTTWQRRARPASLNEP